jgi:hypothetical protein
MSRTLSAGLAAVVLSTLTLAPAHAEDRKFVAATECLPYAPTTSAAELVYSQNGVYNPGASLEKVICPLPRDQDVATSDANFFTAIVFYRVMSATPARMTCTLWFGSTSMLSVASYSLSANGPYADSGARVSLTMAAYTEPYAYFGSPGHMICALPPKTSFAGMHTKEYGATQL